MQQSRQSISFFSPNRGLNTPFPGEREYFYGRQAAQLQLHCKMKICRNGCITGLFNNIVLFCLWPALSLRKASDALRREAQSPSPILRCYCNLSPAFPPVVLWHRGRVPLQLGPQQLHCGHREPERMEAPQPLAVE